MKYLKFVLLIICLTFSLPCYASGLSVRIDNSNIGFDIPPIMHNDRVLVPMRKIFEELDCTVEWLGKTQTVVATKNNTIIALQVGKNKIISTDIETGITEVKEIDIAPVIYENITMVPARVISEALGYAVEWSGEEQTVHISTQR